MRDRIALMLDCVCCAIFTHNKSTIFQKENLFKFSLRMKPFLVKKDDEFEEYPVEKQYLKKLPDCKPFEDTEIKKIGDETGEEKRYKCFKILEILSPFPLIF